MKQCFITCAKYYNIGGIKFGLATYFKPDDLVWSNDLIGASY
jgi:hypothetical protein